MKIIIKILNKFLINILNILEDLKYLLLSIYLDRKTIV